MSNEDMIGLKKYLEECLKKGTREDYIIEVHAKAIDMCVEIINQFILKENEI